MYGLKLKKIKVNVVICLDRIIAQCHIYTYVVLLRNCLLSNEFSTPFHNFSRQNETFLLQP